MQFEVDIDVWVHDGIAEPEGLTVERSLPAVGFTGVSRVRVGKRIRFLIDADSQQAAESVCRRMVDEFLTNPVIERGDVVVRPC